MAKPLKIKQVRPSIEDIDTPAEVETVQSVEDTPEEVEETSAPVQVNVAEAAVRPVAQKTPDKVRISVFSEINPSPRIGNFSFDHDMGLSILKVGVYEVPYNVGMVLIDKKVAQLV